MRKLIVFMHTSLDGFVAGPGGEMRWITVNEEIFDLVAELTGKADAALYGRTTYEMMQSYWPTAGDDPGASEHDTIHSAWYNGASKIVLSRTMSENGPGRLTVISHGLADRINRIKKQEGKDILVFGSPTAVHALLGEDLVDEFWLLVNPVLLGQGIPLFKDVKGTKKLNFIETKTFPGGIIALHYATAAR